MFLIKRKGLNYYTDYTELYLHKSFEAKGYYLVKDESKCLFDVVTDISEDKYMAVLSPYFDTLSDDEIVEFAAVLSSNFKSEVITVPCIGEYRFKGTPYRCMFSDIYNAFEEDVYVYDARPEFFIESYSKGRCNSPYLITYVNYGGEVNGLDITVSFDIPDVVLSEASIIYYKGKDRISKELVFEKTENEHKCSVPDFYMEKGLNKYSAVYRGRKLADEKEKNGFSIRFIPLCNGDDLNVEIKVEAK